MNQVIKKEVPPRTSTTKVADKAEKVKVITPLKDWVEAYLDANERIKALQDELTPLKEAKDAIKLKIIEVFKERGEYSSRIEGATVSLSVRKTATVVNEALVIDQLKAKGLEQYVSESLNDLFDEPKKLMAAGTEDLLDGMVIKETEFISVRTNEKKDARKIVAGEYKQLK